MNKYREFIRHYNNSPKNKIYIHVVEGANRYLKANQGERLDILNDEMLAYLYNRCLELAPEEDDRLKESEIERKEKEVAKLIEEIKNLKND